MNWLATAMLVTWVSIKDGLHNWTGKHKQIEGGVFMFYFKDGTEGTSAPVWRSFIMVYLKMVYGRTSTPIVSSCSKRSIQLDFFSSFWRKLNPKNGVMACCTRFCKLYILLNNLKSSIYAKTFLQTKQLSDPEFTHYIETPPSSFRAIPLTKSH